MASVKKRIVNTGLIIAYSVVVMTLLLFGTLKKESVGELDSYLLPMVALEHRGALVIVPEDIKQAQIDFENYYAGVETYDDLRSGSKLYIIDESHYLPYYFPIYSFICLPTKIILEYLHLDQTRCVGITAALMLILAINIILWFYQKKEKDTVSGVLLLLLLLVCPIWSYITRVGIESIAFSTNVIAMLMWKNEKYMPAALIVSVVCMANPTMMAIGIVLFIDYMAEMVIKEKKGVFSRKNIIKTLLLCACYIPSLIPFVFNYIHVRRLNLTVVPNMQNEETMLRRALAYFFDTNLGIASFGIVILVAFFATLVYACVKRNRRLILWGGTAVFMTYLFSYMTHINSDMNQCARYVIWTYPIVAFSVHECLTNAFEKKKIVFIVASCAIVLPSIIQLKLNREYGPCDWSSTSVFLLNHCPSLYISFCPSTFNCRSNHVDGGYYPQETLYYLDSKSGEIRKIMYRGNRESIEPFLEKMNKIGMETEELEKEMYAHLDGKIHFISVNPWEEKQYPVAGRLYCYTCLEDARDLLLDDFDLQSINGMSGRILEQDETVYSEISFAFSHPAVSDEQYINEVYTCFLHREISENEMQVWMNTMDGKIERKELLRNVLLSAEFQDKMR